MTDQEIIEVVTAHRDRNEVEIELASGRWYTISSQYQDWDFAHYRYRVKSKPVVRYVNWYRSGQPGLGHPTREAADKDTVGERIACTRIEFTPGQYDQ